MLSLHTATPPASRKTRDPAPHKVSPPCLSNCAEQSQLPAPPSAGKEEFSHFTMRRLKLRGGTFTLARIHSK
jgi:hypothetical protein